MSKRYFKVAARAAVSLALLAAMGYLARLPYGQKTTHAVLRVSVRAAAQQHDTCQTRSDAELARLPVHMRQKTYCERRLLPYRLRIDINGEPKLDKILQPRGVHGDRPVVSDNSFHLVPGSHLLTATLIPASTNDQTAPVGFEYNGSVTLTAGQIAVLKMDRQTNGFVLHSGSTAGQRRTAPEL